MKDLLAAGHYASRTVNSNRKNLPLNVGKIKLKDHGALQMFQCVEEPLALFVKTKKSWFFFPLDQELKLLMLTEESKEKVVL